MTPEKSHSHSSTQYEGEDLNLNVVFKAIVVILVATIATVLLLKPIFRYHDAQHHIVDDILNPNLPEQFQVDKKFPKPRLQVSDAMDLATFRAEEAGILNNYAWEDKANGIVRVPIEDAMNRLLQKGLPYRKEASK